MSTSELKQTLNHLSAEDRFFAAVYLHHLALSSDTAWQQEMEATQQAMDAGRKFSLKQIGEMHEALGHEGL